jgi:hypothetical protein
MVGAASGDKECDDNTRQRAHRRGCKAERHAVRGTGRDTDQRGWKEPADGNHHLDQQETAPAETRRTAKPVGDAATDPDERLRPDMLCNANQDDSR